MTSQRVGAGTVGALLDDIARLLESGGGDDPAVEAREIVAALVDAPRYWPLVNMSTEVGPALYERAIAAAERRRLGAPLAYAVGVASFRHLTLAVDERVLIPRPETEQLVELVLRAAPKHGVIVDVGTGSGAIALALATEGTFARVYATDVSLDALAVAHTNVERYRASLRAPVELRHGSTLAPASEVKADVIVSNPPYIALHEAPELAAGVRDWEPAVALFGGTDGMSVTARLVREAAGALAPGGLLALEVDVRRAALVAELMGREPALSAVRVERDLTGRERFVLARRQEGGG